MCGRTGLTLNKDQVICACSFRDLKQCRCFIELHTVQSRYLHSYKPTSDDVYSKPEWMHEHNDGREYKPSYNIAPTDVTPVLISASKFKTAANTSRILKPMMWGIIPPWHKGHYRTHNLSTNNCRLEGIQGSKLYGPILQDGGRCVIVVEGFYEWQTTNKANKHKQPYYIYSPQDENIQLDEPGLFNNCYDDENGWKGIKLLHMAGLYHVWQNDGVIIYSYSVITMESNSTLNWLHHRMPAILDSEHQINAWLNISDVDPHMALGYLRPVKTLSWHPVSTLVNNSRNKSADCNKKINLDQKNKTTQKTLTGWFIKPEKRKKNDNSGGEPKRQK